jgi:hypothetical protein
MCGKKLYLGNTTVPLHIWVVGPTLADTQRVEISMGDADKLQLGANRVIIDSPYFFIEDGNRPALFRGMIDRWSARRFMYDSLYFTLSAPISPSSVILRTLDNGRHQYILSKEKQSFPYVIHAPALLEKQLDGYFCTDGMLLSDPNCSYLVYLYYYRNQFICMDSNLNLIYRGNTIDTFRKAQIKVASINNGETYTLSAPPLLVNRKSCIYGNHLFINSNIPSKNEDMRRFAQSSVIDIYDLKTGHYQGSFYLPDYDSKKVKLFYIRNHQMIVFCDNYLATYQFNLVI